MAEFMVVGDTHGNSGTPGFTDRVCKFAKYHGIDTVYQVGDFGIWDHTQTGIQFLDSLSQAADKRGLVWFFVAGNHENYDSLAVYAEKNTLGNGMVPIRDNIIWLGRENVWQHGNIMMGCVGGAYSIDKHARTQGISWWPQELTTMGDVLSFEARLDGYGIDVLLTHDAPMTLPEFEGFIKDDPTSNYNRMLMDSVGDIAGADIWFHGHYHKELEYRYKNTLVYGLDCNIRHRWAGSNAAIYDNGTVHLLEID